MHAIDYDQATSQQVIEWRPSQQQMNVLFNSGLLDEINERCGTLIGEFEEEVIVGQEKLRIALSILNKYIQWPWRRQVLKQLTSLVQEGIARDTAVYFFL